MIFRTIGASSRTSHQAMTPAALIILALVSYMVDGMLSVGVAHSAATCPSTEITRMGPPSGQTSSDYLQRYISALGKGDVLNRDAISDCQCCALMDTDSFLTEVNVSFEHWWRNFGILWGHVVLNVAVGWRGCPRRNV
ncbi:hypothetical protein VKT23_019157 [Stygiomarasmius scandens]|uniref:Uncharacterized protein n=1 Tax=Marasmiellus scandens TaxID=2682957 RepID=A0ABR1IM76_9AGAR